MFCKNCGSELNENMVFCTECGTKIVKENELTVENKSVEEQPNLQPVAEVSETGQIKNVVSEEILPPDVQAEILENEIEEQNVHTAPQVTKSKRNKYNIITLIILSLIIVGVAAYFVIDAVNYYLDKSDVKAAVSDYIDVIYLGETEKIEDMIPDELDGEITELFEDGFMDEIKEVANQRSAALDEEYGNNIIIKYEITMFDVIDDDALDVYMLYINSMDIVRNSDVEKIYRLSLDVKVEGDKADKTYNHKMLAYEIDGDWYLARADFQFAIIDSYYQYLEIDDLYYIESEEDYYW